MGAQGKVAVGVTAATAAALYAVAFTGVLTPAAVTSGAPQVSQQTQVLAFAASAGGWGTDVSITVVPLAADAAPAPVAAPAADPALPPAEFPVAAEAPQQVPAAMRALEVEPPGSISYTPATTDPWAGTSTTTAPPRASTAPAPTAPAPTETAPTPDAPVPSDSSDLGSPPTSNARPADPSPSTANASDTNASDPSAGDTNSGETPTPAP